MHPGPCEVWVGWIDPAVFTLYLVDLSEPVVRAWQAVFAGFDKVSIEQCNIVDIADDTVISPANSYGDMGGGVDLVYRDFFGRQLERKVQGAIAEAHGNYLPIGEALLVETDHAIIPRMIVSPTMFLPEPTSQLNVYKSMCAALRVAKQWMDSIDTLFCPGMGTGIGCVSPEDAAEAMVGAYNDILTP